MSLTVATLALGLVLLVVGVALLWRGRALVEAVHARLRSPAWTVALFGGGTGWFLWKVLHLAEADFGNWRWLLFVIFLATGIGSFFVVRDFLAVRGAAILWLLMANELLAAAYMQEPVARLILVTGVYIGIVMALWFGISPFRARDACRWLERDARRTAFLGVGAALWGAAMLGAALTY